MSGAIYTGVKTGVGPTPAIWYDCPWSAIDSNPELGFRLYDDFVAFAPTAAAATGCGRYQAWGSTGLTFSPAGILGGGVTFGSDGDNEGAGIGTWGNPFKIYSGGPQFWFEASLATSTIADTKHGIFLGLLDSTAVLSATVPIAADGTLADKNLIGFWRLEGDGDKVDTYYKANGQTAVPVGADAVTLVADTFVKLGMRFKDDVLTFYADGTALADTITKTVIQASAASLPDGTCMGLAFAVLNATATTPGSTTLRWWRAAQLRS